jgi:hypothetical protein
MAIDSKTFQKTLTYTATACSKQIFQDLEAIAKIDKEVEKNKSKFTAIFFISLIGAFILAFLTPTVPALRFLVVGCIISMVVGNIFMVRYSRLHIPNYRYELLKKVLSMLERDRKQDTDVNINLILSSPTDKTKQTSTGSHPYRQGWNIKFFQNEWLNLEGKLLDNNRFQLTLTELYQIASGRNFRGKYKSKTKAKGGEILLKLVFSQRQYGAIKLLKQEAQEAIRLPEKVRFRSLNVTDKAILLKVKLAPELMNNQAVLYQTITMMLLSLYQILNLAKLLSKKK